MSKIVFFCIPAHGHTNPTLGVVKELVSRGHQVWYYSYNIMREKIVSTGATFISCDDYDMEQNLSAKDSTRVGKDLAFSTKILVDTTLALDDKVCADMVQLKPDCIVADSMAVWGKAVAMKLGIPFVSSTTTFAFNQHSAKIMKQGIGELFKMVFQCRKSPSKSSGFRTKGILSKTSLTSFRMMIIRIQLYILLPNFSLVQRLSLINMLLSDPRFGQRLVKLRKRVTS